MDDDTSSSPVILSTIEWSEHDDAVLRRYLEEGNGRLSWAELAAAAFPDEKYSKDDCMERWRVLSKPKPLRGPWLKTEDAKLLALVDVYGSEKWVIISTEMLTRSGKQCRERWHNHLDPTINKGEWTPEEDAIIHRLYLQIGSRWAEMAKSLPGRPDNAIKNYWNAAQIRLKRARGGSISTIASIASVASTSSTGGDQSPAMSRSNSTTRFTPYNKSSPMSKSRSEQFINTSAATFSPHRKGSATAAEANGSPLKSPLGMSRSHSLSAQAFATPATTSSSRSSRPASIISTQPPRRDLTKDVFDHHQHSPTKSPMQQYRSRMTPPATPDLSPTASSSINTRLSEFPFYDPTDPNPSSPAATYHQPGVHQVFDSSSIPWLSRSESYQDLEPFEALQVSEERSFEPYSAGGEGGPSHQHQQHNQRQQQQHQSHQPDQHHHFYDDQSPYQHDPSPTPSGSDHTHQHSYSDSSSDDTPYPYPVSSLHPSLYNDDPSSNLSMNINGSSSSNGYNDPTMVIVHPHHQLSSHHSSGLGGGVGGGGGAEWIVPTMNDSNTASSPFIPYSQLEQESQQQQLQQRSQLTGYQPHSASQLPLHHQSLHQLHQPQHQQQQQLQSQEYGYRPPYLDRSDSESSEMYQHYSDQHRQQQREQREQQQQQQQSSHDHRHHQSQQHQHHQNGTNTPHRSNSLLKRGTGLAPSPFLIQSSSSLSTNTTPSSSSSLSSASSGLSSPIDTNATLRKPKVVTSSRRSRIPRASPIAGSGSRIDTMGATPTKYRIAMAGGGAGGSELLGEVMEHQSQSQLTSSSLLSNGTGSGTMSLEVDQMGRATLPSTMGSTVYHAGYSIY